MASVFQLLVIAEQGKSPKVDKLFIYATLMEIQFPWFLCLYKIVTDPDISQP